MNTFNRESHFPKNIRVCSFLEETPPFTKEVSIALKCHRARGREKRPGMKATVSVNKEQRQENVGSVHTLYEGEKP